MTKTLLASLIALAVLTGCGDRAPPTAPPAPPTTDGALAPATARVQLDSVAGSGVVGTLELATSEGGVTITGWISGLQRGTEHAFHVHERGDCSAPDASSAGEHFNPGSMPHGAPTADQHHLGDLPNILAGDDGRAELSVAMPLATLRDGGPRDLIGRSFIVHLRRDDYVSQPAGDAGERIACGVIR